MSLVSRFVNRDHSVFSGSHGVVIVVVVSVVIDQVDRIFSLPLVAMDSASLRSPSATETWGK